MYDDATDTILTINHSSPEGTAVGHRPEPGEVVGDDYVERHARPKAA